MKLTAQQLTDIRKHVLQVSLKEDGFHEIYDHIVTSFENQKIGTEVNLEEVKKMIHTDFNELVNTPKEKKTFNLINKIAGVGLFIIALIVYSLTMEPTVSFWDCGEFIATASKLQVGHQPGAPLFLMIGKLFSLLSFGNTGKIALWINFSAVLASAATIMFLFWTITALAVKALKKEKIKNNTFIIIAAGTIGALALTFSDSFWFSAVESEVYALSCLFTAITFWAILKWEDESNDKWLVLIAFIVGLSIGVHLLSLLVIPALGLIFYFKKQAKPSIRGTLTALFIGCLIVGIVQFIIIQYFVLFAAKFDLLFVNSLRLPFGSGALFFILLTAGLLSYGIHYSIKQKKRYLNLSLLCTAFLLFGFSSYFMILIRANAKPAINLSNPDNAFSLYNYLGRTNYGSTPLLYGNTFDAKAVENVETGKTYSKGAKSYEETGSTYKTSYDKNLWFPRTYSQKPGHDQFYREWLNMQEGETPTMLQNLHFFASWQMGFMYWRYFLWNFSGRQNDNQGQGGVKEGNWISGIKALDGMRLGNQSNLPESIVSNKGYNVFYGLPMLLGFIGLVWMSRKHWKDGMAVMVLFLLTGIAIIIYLNQDPLQVRERDYAYVGSFYAFTIFIGLGVLALKEWLGNIALNKYSQILVVLLCLTAVPVLMGVQGWDDHDRSNRHTAADWAKNYLNSCAPNAILFTNADNDTFPLWYAQEVEGFRTDVRVICLQFLPDDAYINQLKKQLNRSAPLPVSMAEEKYKEGTRDYFPYMDYGIKDSVELKDLLAVMLSDNKEDQVQMNDESYANFLPSKKLKMSIDSDQLVKTNTIAPEEKDLVAKTMEWTFNKTYASKGDLALFDILVNNDWKRPIYFATSVSDDTYIGLDKYLYLEGYAYRLLPFKTPADDIRDKTEKTHSDVMYTNVMDKQDYTGFKSAKYLDPESRNVAKGTWNFNNALIANLINEGKSKKAEDVLLKCMKELPLKNNSINDTLGKIATIQSLYALNHVKEANQLSKETSDYIVQELNYVAELEPEFKQSYAQNIQLGLYVSSGLDKISAHYKQGQLNLLLKNRLKLMADKFGYKS
jgi:hypothetical protein